MYAAIKDMHKTDFIGRSPHVEIGILQEDQRIRLVQLSRATKERVSDYEQEEQQADREVHGVNKHHRIQQLGSAMQNQARDRLG